MWLLEAKKAKSYTPKQSHHAPLTLFHTGSVTYVITRTPPVKCHFRPQIMLFHGGSCLFVCLGGPQELQIDFATPRKSVPGVGFGSTQEQFY